LGGLAAFIGITAKEDQVCAIFKGIVYTLVEGKQEIEEA